MAQALFDEHPLGDYLRDIGETPLLIPGIYPGLEHELVDLNVGLDSNSSGEWLPRVLLDFIEFLQSAISSAHADNPSPFVEKFKYNIISSSLLTPALSSPYSRRSSSISLPGKLAHSRASSMELDAPISPVPPSEPSYGIISFSTASAAALFSTGYPFLALIALIVTLLLVYNFVSTTDSHQSDMSASLNALDDLIQANQVWESVVQDALNVLERDERMFFQHNSPNSPLTPSHVRVALHSCLQTTHTQCDNIRNIFSALTCPAELSQLSEMYAPHSPSKNSPNSETNSPPFSFPRSSPPPSFTTPNNKRATWNGSYTSLASAGSPSHSHRRRHRGGIPDPFDSRSNSAPATPGANSLRTNTLPDFLKQSSVEEDNSSFPLSESNHFGVAALELQRKKKSRALETFRSFPSSSNSCDPRNVFVSTSPASKFTSLQPVRHPLSLSALKFAVKNAISAKRFTCSHLLALRFSDEEDEGYWEDVRSLMGLLISTLADVSSRLSEVLDEAEQQSRQDQILSPFSMPPSSDDETTFRDQQNQITSYRSPRTDGRVSFAPMPTHISRFAAHVAAITSALDDAKDNMDQCISALKEDSSGFSSFSGSLQTSQRPRNIPKTTESAPEEAVPLALQAYERLRRELGLALRECERGRDRLLEIVNPPASPSDGEESDDLPSLGHDGSDKTDSISPNLDDEEIDLASLMKVENVATVMVGREKDGDAGDLLIDDATSHLLLTASTKHLPMPGIEEVFEADMGTRGVFARERSKLTREERIKAAKARRESGLGSLGITLVGGGDCLEAQKMGGIEKWGPGGEVVQELKDVIWKVSERKRKMADASQTAQQSI